MYISQAKRYLKNLRQVSNERKKKANIASIFAVEGASEPFFLLFLVLTSPQCHVPASKYKQETKYKIIKIYEKSLQREKQN